MLPDLKEKVDGLRDSAIEILSKIIEIKAISPDSGGEGELKKAEKIESHLDGFDVERLDVKDDRAYGGVRPNILARIRGEQKRTIWIVSHMDVVPEGDERLWNTPPFRAVVEDGKIYGRGSEDNGQSLVASLIAGKAILELGLTPYYTLGLAFVADEETGSKYGIQELIKRGVFEKDDLIVVPDGGTPKGDMIEIAEKSVVWFKFSVFGKQTHASMPEKGLNANRMAMEFLLGIDRALRDKYSKTNPIFQPPVSTFEPTKREANVDNVNTIPGLDVSYMDCRILPEYNVDEVIEFVNRMKEGFEKEKGCRIEVEVVQREFSPPTDENSEVVRVLSRAIESVRGIRPGVYGMGGNTCGAFFRKAGFQTAVWSTVDNTAHQPNEYCRIDNLVEDAKVFAYLPFVRL
ncbi:acetylornithine deacetylase or succinyl-diaminopimelate desuccinylase [Archaeoglobus sulfaticallidus PM70-1]|uniref:Acetylornithine deacetylase or succinyl-diaminopimelate desuccinylase n=1 Tax=Archaeoglobus sulfaticallidus PM70-1 TaxID=387631 RepID=N0BJ97_9EURY|nr:M20 family metallo-hydrolase [Archaeoglobus sulfaticallidus]AGK60521.1 acetylornithine deacetylase or succinyl-diaminopimelate desuccinylase [Archaeoglobus sulfaticallidus PM70-1]